MNLCLTDIESRLVIAKAGGWGKEGLRIWGRKVQTITYRMVLLYSAGFLGSSVVKNRPAMQKTQEAWVPSLHQEDLLEEGVAIHSSILA